MSRFEGKLVSDWDPETYLEFADERGRPFMDLVGRIGAQDPETVVDLGCGPGNLTALLSRRWPSATVIGVDSSPAMLESARALTGNRLQFTLADLRQWRSPTPVDILICNATLQWVPGHRELLPQLVAALRPGGWLAFSVPGNFAEASHRLLREQAGTARYAGYLNRLEWPAAFDAATYLADLAGPQCRVDAWETTYLHVLSGPDAVFRWISATGARPVLAALPAGVRERFETEYKARLNEAYP